MLNALMCVHYMYTLLQWACIFYTKKLNTKAMHRQKRLQENAKKCNKIRQEKCFNLLLNVIKFIEINKKNNQLGKADFGGFKICLQ